MFSCNPFGSSLFYFDRPGIESTKNLVIDFCIDTASSPAASFSTIDLECSSPVMESRVLFGEFFPENYSFFSYTLLTDFDLKSLSR